MDPQRFDRLTQTLARKLHQDPGAEPHSPVLPADQPALRAAAEVPAARSTCVYQDLATKQPEPGVDRQGAVDAIAICGWEHSPAMPATNHDPRPVRTGRSVRHQQAQPLSAREQEIAALIARGLRDREIATALVLSEHTVHAHVRNLLDKLGLASRTQIAAWVAARAPDDQRSVLREQAEL